MSFADALRERTRDLHIEAERSGIVADVLRRRASRHGYILLLRNILPVYQQLERGLTCLSDRPALHEIARPELFRSRALEADLLVLFGPGWDLSLPILPSSRTYADQVASAAKGDGSRLIAHAYVRYLGDLNGGQILSRILARSLGLDAHGLSFYDFPDILDVGSFTAQYRAAFDRVGDAMHDWEEVLAEARLAFKLNIDLSLDVQEAAARHPEAAPLG